MITFLQARGEIWKKIHDTVVYLCDHVDPYETLSLTEYLEALGLSVLPQFRGQGIGLELLNARYYFYQFFY